MAVHAETVMDRYCIIEIAACHFGSWAVDAGFSIWE
jgi:hypothetical protein